MNEKLKGILGEKAAEVEQILKDKGIDIGITNDGTLVPADKHESLKAKLKEAEDFMAKAKNTDNSTAKENSELKSMIDNLKGEFDSYKQEVAKARETSGKKSALEKALRAAKVNPDALELLIASTDLDKLEVGEKGISEDFIKSIQEKRPSLFGSETINSEKTKDTKPGDVHKHYTMDEIKAMSQAEMNKNLDDVKASLREINKQE